MQHAVSSTPAELRQSVEAADRRFMDAFNAGEIDRAVDVIYTRNARILPPGAELVEGRARIAEFWKGAVQQLGVRSVQLATVDLERCGDALHQVGRATLTLGDGANVEAKYVVVWKQEDGDWRWDIDIWNLNV